MFIYCLLIYIGGFFQCSGSQMVKGYAGKYSSYNKFHISRVSDADAQQAQALVHLSNQISEIESKYASKLTKSKGAQATAVTGTQSSSAVPFILISHRQYLPLLISIFFILYSDS